MPIVNRWFGLFVSLILLLLVPFIFFQEITTQWLQHALETELNKTFLAGLIALALASDVVFPIPSSLASTAAGAGLGFGTGTIVCWFGMSLGCFIGYWLGSKALTPAVQRFVGVPEFEKARFLGKEYGTLVLILTRAVPILAEASVITAGLIGVPKRLFYLATGLSNFGISAVYAGIGALAFNTQSLFLAFSGAVLVPGVATLFIRLSSRSKMLTTSSFNHQRWKETHTSREKAGHMVEQHFEVAYHYRVYFTEKLFDPRNHLFVRALLKENSTRRYGLTVFVDDGVTAAWPNLQQDIERYTNAHKTHLYLSTSPISVPGGETCKNDPTVLQMIYGHLFKLGVDRQSLIVAIGGGAVLDTVGYAAATTHRGIRLVRLPTTVLGQNDAGVGVKTGMNLFDLKNFLGTFAPPYAVFNDFCFLETLPPRDRRAGMAEAVKVALIKDLNFFCWIEDHVQQLNEFDKDTISIMIRRSAELHLCHIAQGGDPFEAGNVRPLDYGHWAAHKMESLTGHELRHGEAVAIGMAIDTRYATQIGLLSKDLEHRILHLLENLGFDLWHPVMHATSPQGNLLLTDGLREFQEHLGGTLSITLLTHIGQCLEVQEMDDKEIAHAINWLKARRQPL